MSDKKRRSGGFEDIQSYSTPKGFKNKIANSILIKPNQVGTFYEMLETVVLAKKNNYTTIMSHRSGETDDTFIIDVAVALGIPFVKCGSLSRGERICKFNRLLKIEEKLNRENK